jgi:hypothetical protein
MICRSYPNKMLLLLISSWDGCRHVASHVAHGMVRIARTQAAARECPRIRHSPSPSSARCSKTRVGGKIRPKISQSCFARALPLPEHLRRNFFLLSKVRCGGSGSRGTKNNGVAGAMISRHLDRSLTGFTAPGVNFRTIATGVSSSGLRPRSAREGGIGGAGADFRRPRPNWRG